MISIAGLSKNFQSGDQAVAALRVDWEVRSGLVKSAIGELVTAAGRRYDESVVVGVRPEDVKFN